MQQGRADVVRAWMAIALTALIVVVFSDVRVRNAIVKPAWAAMAVIDSANLEKNAATYATVVKQLAEVQKILETAEKTYKSIGAAGGAAQDAMGKIFQVGTGSGSALGFSGGMNGSLPDLQDLQLPDPQGGQGEAAAVPNLKNITSAIEWVKTTLSDVSDGDDFERRQAIRRLRRTLAQDYEKKDVAAALHHLETSALVSTRVSTLSNQAAAAGELRQDVQANTAVLLAVLEEMAAQRNLMAHFVAMEGAARLYERPALLVANVKAEGEGADAASGGTEAGPGVSAGLSGKLLAPPSK